MSSLGFFPTPYPDELFYSVLCRYHIRCGVPLMGITNREISGYKFGSNIYIPQAIGRLAELLPNETGMNAEYFLRNTTVFPFIKPFIPLERSKRIVDILQNNESESAYKISGFSRVESLKIHYLRYCPLCIKEDNQKYGEAYWHRVHQLPGVYFCPVHEIPILDSEMRTTLTGRIFYPASAVKICSTETVPKFLSSISEKMLSLSKDAAWVLEYGYESGSLEKTMQKYYALIGQKGLLLPSGKKIITSRLNEAITEFFGTEFLDILMIQSKNVTPWSSDLFYKKNKLSNPIWHLLMIQFLRGTAENFFHKEITAISPYGTGPWMCRNPVCDYHMQNVIEHIEVIYDQSRFKATFSCPYCGYTYRRSNGGHVDETQNGLLRYCIVDYGWKWEELMLKYLKDGVPVMKITKLMHCGYRKVMEFGAANGFFEPERVPKRYQGYYTPVEKTENSTYSYSERRKLYRQKWSTLVAENTNMSRSELIRRLPAVHRWLIDNDLEWYERNSPPSRRHTNADWKHRDIKWLEEIEHVVEGLLQSKERPVWISMRIIERLTGLHNLSRAVHEGKLPLTKAYLDKNIETRDEWNRRRIIWAANKLYEEEKLIGLFALRKASGLSKKMFEPLTEYASGYIHELQRNNDN